MDFIKKEMDFIKKEIDYLYKLFVNDVHKEDCKKPHYTPKFWNKLDKDIKDYTNCYSYAFDRLEIDADKKLQPGELSTGKFKRYDCGEILDKVRSDYNNYDIVEVNKDDIAPCGYYKIALVIDDKGEEQDYHFYRQDFDGYWSHKPGKNKVRRYDASKNLIKDPETADRNYDMSDDNQNNESDNNYYEFCGYYLVPYEGGGPFKRFR